MIYNLYNNGELVNTIVASEDFVVSYAESMDYTYELVPEPPAPAPEPTPEPTPEEISVTWTAIADSIKEGVDDV